jgi:precorrin-6B methylase 2
LDYKEEQNTKKRNILQNEKHKRKNKEVIKNDNSHCGGKRTTKSQKHVKNEPPNHVFRIKIFFKIKQKEMPLLTRKVSSKRRNKTRRALDKAFKGINAFGGRTEGIPFNTTYGEMTQEGIEVLSDILQKHGGLLGPGKVFYDLGCGSGKIPCGIALLHPTLRAKGIEVVQDRFQLAEKARRALPADVQRRVDFYWGSFLDEPLHDMTSCFISNLCFGSELNEKIARKLETDVKPGTIIVCSTQLPLTSNFTYVEETTCPMTWSENSRVHVYKRL